MIEWAVTDASRANTLYCIETLIDRVIRTRRDRCETNGLVSSKYVEPSAGIHDSELVAIAVRTHRISDALAVRSGGDGVPRQNGIVWTVRPCKSVI